MIRHYSPLEKRNKMKTVIINGKEVQLLKEIGAGQEAIVYDIGGGFVAKIYRKANDPFYTNNPVEQLAAKQKIAVMSKKLQAFPTNLPQNVITAQALVTDKKGQFLGYVMRFVQGAESLLTYGDIQYRENNSISNTEIQQIFINLHSTLKSLHHKGIVIGDMNDLNILVKNKETLLIDTDSFQFGGFMSTMYTEKFVDPLLCGEIVNSTMSRWTMIQPHTKLGDWYSFTGLLFKTLLFVDPYGGIHKPKDSRKKLKPLQRIKNRVTVFDDEVVYPKHATPYTVLPKQLLEYFKEVFISDKRSEFPLHLLNSLQWKHCSQCGIEHATLQCPMCNLNKIIPIVVSNSVKAQEIFKTTGTILQAVLQSGKLYILYYENGAYRRETGEILLTSTLERNLHFSIQQNASYIANSNCLIKVKSEKAEHSLALDTVGTKPLFATNSEKLFWMENGILKGENPLGLDYSPILIGQGIANQTLFWVGEHLGFGMYKAGSLLQGFTFNPNSRGINDQINLPSILGEIIDAKAYISDEMIWLCLAVKDKAKYLNHLVIISKKGEILLHCDTSQDEYPWLEEIKGKCANGKYLFIPTNDGITRVGLDISGAVETKVFSDTAPYVNQRTQLLVSPKGIYVIKKNTITLLSVK